jgi:hypothetical protein
MNIIKISEEVFETILTNDTAAVDDNHLPFNSFCIAFPYAFLKSAEEMIDDTLKEFKKAVNAQGLSYKRMLEEKKEEIDATKQAIRSYCNSDLHVMFESKSEKITVKSDEIIVNHSKSSIIQQSIIHQKEQILFNCKLNEITPIPVVAVNQMSNDSLWTYYTLRKLIFGVVYAINNRDIEIVESSSQPNKQNGGTHIDKKAANIRYITSIKHYSIKNHVNDGTKRMYTMEAWEVRGHWRTLRSGSKVWVNSYIKGDREKFKERDNLYVLNKIKGDEICGRD